MTGNVKLPLFEVDLGLDEVQLKKITNKNSIKAIVTKQYKYNYNKRT